MGEVLPAIRLREHEQQVTLRHVPDQEHVELPVVGLRVGAHHHPAAQVAAVGDNDVDHLAASDLVVDRQPHLAGLPAREHGEGCPVVGDLPAEGLRSLVRALRDCAADARTQPRSRSTRGVHAGPGAIGDEAEVDLADSAVQRDGDCGIQIARNVVRANEVPSCSARDHGQLDVFRLGDAVHDLVHRAVPADDDEELRSSAYGVCRKRDELSRLLGDEGVTCEAERGRPVRDLGPTLPRRASGGSRVDEEDGAAGANDRSVRRLPSRVQFASCGPRLYAAPRRRSERTRPRRRCRSP